MKKLFAVLLLCSIMACTNNKQVAEDVQEIVTEEVAEDAVDLTDTIISFLTEFTENKDENGNYVYDLPSESEMSLGIDREWYMQNIDHVAEVSQQVITHLKANDHLSALNLLDKELDNFYAHPNTDTEGTFILSIAVDYLMTQCYGAESDKTIAKGIELYEFCLLRADAVQCAWDTYHPVFLQMLHSLNYLYKKKGDEEKMAILNDICAYVDSHEKKEVGLMLGMKLMK